MPKRIVITGGPGTGKTMVINELINRAYECQTEISRQVTLKAREDGIDQLFLTKPLLFSELLLEGRLAQYNDENNGALTFFDRGIPDVHAYMEFLGSEYPDTFKNTSEQHRYDQVFLMPPWEEIYTSDNERYESYEESLAIYTNIKKVYLELGYDIIEVPKGNVNERTNFILDHI